MRIFVCYNENTGKVKVVEKFRLVKVDYHYCDYLRSFDNKVCYNSGTKELRPYLGILFEINNCEYFAPLSSPKPKHKSMPNNLDFVKIDNGNLGAINFNNMLPLTKANYKILDLNDKNLKYSKLLHLQLRWLNRHYNYIFRQANTLYKKYINNTLDKKIKMRCCNFILLEEKCLEYNGEFDKI